MIRGLVGFMLVLTLLGGGMVHASVTHEHGHSHSAEESSIWTSLHSSLRHEDKKMLFMLVESTALVLLALVVASSSTMRGLVQSTFRASLRDPYASEALTKGIYKYRAFG